MSGEHDIQSSASSVVVVLPGARSERAMESASLSFGLDLAMAAANKARASALNSFARPASTFW